MKPLTFISCDFVQRRSVLPWVLSRHAEPMCRL